MYLQSLYSLLSLTIHSLESILLAVDLARSHSQIAQDGPNSLAYLLLPEMVIPLWIYDVYDVCATTDPTYFVCRNPLSSQAYIAARVGVNSRIVDLHFM